MAELRVVAGDFGWCSGAAAMWLGVVWYGHIRS